MFRSVLSVNINKLLVGKHISNQFSSTKLKEIKIEKIRNVGIVAHIDAGKTTTSEQMLYLSGETKAIGRVDSGDTVLDFLPQERERGITISSAAITFNWMNENIINLIDTPGHVDFTIEVERSARVLDGAVLVIDAVAGVQAQTRTVWKQLTRNKVPAIAFINKMDRDGASYYRSIDSIKNKLDVNAVAIQYPLGSDDTFTGVIDLISMNKITWPSSNFSSRAPLPPTMEPLNKNDFNFSLYLDARKEMIESIAEIDEIFLEKFLENDESISTVDIISALRRGCISNSIVPTLCGSALRSKGVEILLNSIIAFLPSPSDRPPTKAINRKSISKTIEVHSSGSDLFALAFKIVYDKDKGPMVYVRIFSGVINSKQMLFNSTKLQKERISQLYIVQADEMVLSDQLVSGQVGCIIGLKYTVTGDTLVDLGKGSTNQYVLDGLTIPPPVYSLSIEPEKSIQDKDLTEALKILCIEDPSLVVEINKHDSGQTIIRGIGELHLEIICDKLGRDYNIEVSTGKAYVAYRETIQSTYNTSNPIEKLITFDRIIANKRMFAQVKFRVIAVNNIDPSEIDILPDIKKICSNEEYVALLEGLLNVFNRGPSGYPIVGVKITVTDVIRDADTNAGALKACCGLLLECLFRDNDIRQILEPIMSIEIEIPNDKMGDILNDLTVKRRGVITDVSTENNRTIVSGQVPLVTMLGYSTAIRSMTQGEGSFSMEYKEHAPISIEYLL